MKWVNKVIQKFFFPKVFNWIKRKSFKSNNVENNEIFIRRISSSVDKWLEEGAKFSELADNCLGRKKGNCSVYQLDNILNEAKILLTLFTTPRRLSFSTTASIRIPRNEIEIIGLSLVQTKGTTDVEEIDQLHWEIEGTEEQFERLAELISQGGKKCEDRFRVLEKNRVKEGMKLFVNLPGLPETVLEKCRRALQFN